jgi:hypothetical protein
MVAVLVGARDGVKDAGAGSLAFLWALAFHAQHRREMLRNAFTSASDLVAIAILLDLISQFLIFREIHPAAALLLGPVLIGIPYAVSRGLGNRISRRQGHQENT